MTDHSQLVKPLSWGERYEADDGTICQFADASFGVKYLASEEGWFIQGVTQFNWSGSLSDAKAAAQADYTARILSALNLEANDAVGWLPHPAPPAADTGQAVGFCEPETIEKLLSGKAVGAASISCVRGNVYTVPLYAHPAPFDAERVRELEKALRPFAECAAQIDPDEDDEEWAKFRLLIKDYRAASAALRQKDGGQ